MHSLTSQGMANYASELQRFEAECIFNKRSYYNTPDAVRLIPIVMILIENNKNTMQSILEFNGLPCYLKAEAVTMSENFWGNGQIYSKIQDTYKKVYGQELDISIDKKLRNFSHANNDLPKDEVITYHEYKQIVMGPGRNILHHCYKMAQITLLNINNIQNKKLVKQIKELDCFEFVQLINKIDGKEPLILSSKNDGSKIKGVDATLKLLKDGFQEVTGLRMAGDTILYINENSEIEHVGFFHNSEIVESKWGKFPVYFHAPEHTPYENSYIVMRKS